MLGARLQQQQVSAGLCCAVHMYLERLPMFETTMCGTVSNQGNGAGEHITTV